MMYTTYKSIYARAVEEQLAVRAKRRSVIFRNARKSTMFLIFMLGIYFACTSIVQAWTGDNELKLSSDRQVQQVIVMQGDSLWSIADSHLPINHKEDIRDYIKMIMKHNGMNNSNLMAGDVIEVPLLDTN